MDSGDQTAGGEPRLSAVRRYRELPTGDDTALDRLAAVAARTFETSMAVVSLVGRQRVSFKGRHGLQLDGASTEPGLCATAVHRSSAYVLIDAQADPRARLHPLVRNEPFVRFYAAAPIIVDDQRHIGTVCVMDAAPKRPTAAQLATLRDLAAAASEELKVRRESLDVLVGEQQAMSVLQTEAHRVSQIAETLQTTLTPSRLPTITGLDIAAFYQPFSSDEVGGDFYDLFPIDQEGRWGVFVGDVVGKGLEAAAFTPLARYSLRAAAVGEANPADVLAAVNEALMLDPGSSEALYCTVVYGNLARGTAGSWHLNLAIGGHPPPLLIRGGTEVEVVDHGGTIVGVFPQQQYDATAATLNPGDTLVMYSDGMTDIPTRDGWLGVDGVVAALGDSPVSDASGAVALLRKVVAEGPHPLRDDLVIVAISVPGNV